MKTANGEPFTPYADDCDTCLQEAHCTNQSEDFIPPCQGSATKEEAAKRVDALVEDVFGDIKEADLQRLPPKPPVYGGVCNQCGFRYTFRGVKQMGRLDPLTYCPACGKGEATVYELGPDFDPAPDLLEKIWPEGVAFVTTYRDWRRACAKTIVAQVEHSSIGERSPNKPNAAVKVINCLMDEGSAWERLEVMAGIAIRSCGD